MRRGVFNAAINGASLPFMEQWALDVVVPRLKPDTVVLGLTSRDVNDGNTQANELFSLFNESPDGREAVGNEDVLDVADRWLWSTLLSSPTGQTSRSITAIQSGEPLDTVTRDGTLAAVDHFAELQYQVVPAFTAQYAAKGLHNFHVGQKSLGALDHITRRLTAGKFA